MRGSLGNDLLAALKRACVLAKRCSLLYFFASWMTAAICAFREGFVADAFAGLALVAPCVLAISVAGRLMQLVGWLWSVCSP